ncbi:dihydrodipicolinate synthetase [Beutenbergia cavernae DSM 12333]|uniref:Dihydrodipicolinate synthetase n=1 Tax=Beutenbergia cavernae (strain ATCC BAA-8 / DSM 12333 / CCUG 43141 / JCM 11478 / NBRC 16432 / NCIMB 13614 / HKI 0122) TaxID=471853 RepID=C5C5P2_BEUC1|nr:dihydrodipicolinate synthase family protein [Beutenbergia cavernae]ACQ80233.1 dihydrodipicolinate synthetase [Beutenbergia cavernae DSM 12333]
MRPPPAVRLTAYVLTPAGDDGAVLPELVAPLCARAVEAGVDAVAVLGSTGGLPYLEDDDRERVVRAAAEAVAGRVPLVVGAGGMTAPTLRRAAHDAVRWGADELLVPLLSYWPLTPPEQRAMYDAVLEGLGVPLTLYRARATTTALDLGVVADLAADERVVALKDTSADVATWLEHADVLRGRRAVLRHEFSRDALAVDLVEAGAGGWASALAGVFPDRVVGIRDRAGDGPAGRQAARRELAAFGPLLRLAAAHGAIRVLAEAMRTIGLPGGAPPAPLLRLEPDARRAVERALVTLD